MPHETCVGCGMSLNVFTVPLGVGGEIVCPACYGMLLQAEVIAWRWRSHGIRGIVRTRP